MVHQTDNSTDDPARGSPSWFDLTIVTCVMVGGFLYLRDSVAWAPYAYIGKDQYGDADFWWQGALQLAQGKLLDNINITYRMGYAIFAGLVSAVFGPNYPAFHALLTLVFLAVAASGYMVLAPRVGRPAALAMLLALTLSPHQAEWLAVSTSDGLGLILNLIALLALFISTDRQTKFGWLAVAGLFLSLAALTRPLMTLFVAPAAFIVLFVSAERVPRRLAAVMVFGLAFATPTLLWVSTLYFKTGNFALAGSDASTFFAASTPKYQTWTPEMYSQVQAAAMKRFGSSATPSQINDEFWRETVSTYLSEWRYHLHRLPRDVLETASFSYQQTHPNDRIEFVLRILLRGGLGLALAILAIFERRFDRAVLVLAIAGLSLWSAAYPWIVIAAALLFLLPTHSPKLGFIPRIIASYWWIGAAAMFLIGGIWGPPISTMPTMNALGYRLGEQFLFANEWLVLLAIAAVGAPQTGVSFVPQAIARLFLPQRSLQKGLRTAGLMSLALLGAILLVGAIVVSGRGWQLSHAERMPMPSIVPVIEAICRAQQAGAPLPTKNSPAPPIRLSEMWDDANPTTREEAAEVFTGAVGGLLWQMPVQDRTRALFYTQAFRTPFMIGPERTDVEFVTLIDEETWRNRQGAFVIRSFREERSHRGHPFRAEPPQVQMFFPLAANGTLFDVSRGVTFPVARYAAALGLKLSVHGGTLQWSAFPAADFSRRSFVIVPTEITEASRTVEADLDVTDAVGSRKVSFSFQIEPIPGQPSGPRSANFKIESVDVEGRGETLLTGEAPHPGSSVETSIQPITVDLPASATGVRISIADVPPQEMVRLIELKLISDDVQPTLATTFCQGG